MPTWICLAKLREVRKSVFVLYGRLGIQAEHENQRNNIQKKITLQNGNCFLRVIPTLNHYSDIVSDIPSGSIYGMFILTFYLTIFDILSGIYFDILSDILSGIYPDILFGIYSDIFSDILSGISSEILCGWGPAGNTAIQRLQLRSGGGGGGRGGGGGGGTADIKSNNPYLTGGEKQDHAGYFQCLAWPFRASCHGGVKTKRWSSWLREHLTTACRHWLNGDTWLKGQFASFYSTWLPLIKLNMMLASCSFRARNVTNWLG